MTKPMETTWIPAERFLAVTDKLGHRGYVGQAKGSAMVRTLNRLRSGEQGYIGFGAADKILIAFGLDGMWHVAPELGGLADIYEDGAQYGAPKIGFLAATGSAEAS